MKFFFCVVFIQLFTLVSSQQKLEVNLTAIPPDQEDFQLELYLFTENHFELVLTKDVAVIDTVERIIMPTPVTDTTVRLFQLKVADSPNTSEFLFSPKENMTLSGPLYDLLNGQIGVENSDENAAYARLLRVLGEYEQIMNALEEESSNYSVYDHDFNAKVNEHASLVEEVQHKLNLNLEKVQSHSPKLIQRKC